MRIENSLDARVRKFLEAYPADAPVFGAANWTEGTTLKLIGVEPELFTLFMSRAAAPSHGDGIIKFFSAESSPSVFEWNSEYGWKEDWPEWGGRLVVFAYDWSGSLFGFDRNRKKGEEPLISILEPDTGKLLQTPHSFSNFIGEAVVHEADAVLSASVYQEWRTMGGEVPKVGMCAGAKVPLFLSGTDTVDNLAIQPLGVYVSLCGQMYSHTRNLSPGTKIKGIDLS